MARPSALARQPQRPPAAHLLGVGLSAKDSFDPTAPQQSPGVLQGGGNRRLVRRHLCVFRRKQISVRSPRPQRRGLAQRGQDRVKEAELCLEYLQLRVGVFGKSQSSI